MRLGFRVVGRGARVTHQRASVTARCVGGGGLVAFSMPPWGWWPLAFVGLAMLDRLIAVDGAKFRFRRAAVFGLAWIMPATLWMWALTPPGYLFVATVVATALGGACALVPNGPRRGIGLVGVITLWEAARWSFPFGGVPLATLAMSQADSPLAPVVRLAGPLLLVSLTVIVALAINHALFSSAHLRNGYLVVVVALPLFAAFAPRGETIDEIDVALVQGGGEQGTRAINTDPELVFERHLAASELVERPVDVVIWPENAIDTPARLEDTPKWPILTELAARLDAVLLVGVTEDISDTAFVNSQVAISPDGESLDRYEKQIRVPFGEYVPFRSLVEPLAPDYLPQRDAAKGETDSVLETPVADFGVAISWEIFFDQRVAAGVVDGGEIIVNPTNGSSYWLTILQTQQIASSRLRALETDRYVLQVSPTGFTTIITNTGEVVDRTGISEQAVVQGRVELRTGDTYATALGRSLMVALAFTALLGTAIIRRAASPADPASKRQPRRG